MKIWKYRLQNGGHILSALGGFKSNQPPNGIVFISLTDSSICSRLGSKLTL